MKLTALLALCSCLLPGRVSADIFMVAKKYDAKLKEFYVDQAALDTLIEKVGGDPQVSVTYESSADQRGFEIVYGRLLGVLEGESWGQPEMGMTNDILRIQALTRDGEPIGNPIQMLASSLHPVSHQAAVDTFWDLERIYGSIGGSFETELDSEIFDMVLMGILDPTGEMGLNIVQATIDLPSDFTHGWLTHYAYFGHDPEAMSRDPFALDAINAFNETFLHPVHLSGGFSLVEQLALDTRYNIYEEGLRPHVLKLVGVLHQFRQIDPARLSDPKLIEQAKRLRTLGENVEWLVTHMLASGRRFSEGREHFYGRPLSLQDQAHAALDIIGANVSAFQFHTAQLMNALLNAGQPMTAELPYPHPDCEKRALELYFQLLEAPEMSGDRDRDDRMRGATAYRRAFALRGLIPGSLNENVAFTDQTRAAFRRIGYGTTSEVKLIIDALDSAITQDYQATDIFDTPGFLSVPAPVFDEVFLPIGGSLGQAPTDSPIAVYFDRGNLSDHAFLLHALAILKEIAFNLPEGVVGRERKAALVETWRQQQLKAFEEWPDKQIRPFGEAPPELPEKYQFLQSQLQDAWEAPAGGVEG